MGDLKRFDPLAQMGDLKRFDPLAQIWEGAGSVDQESDGMNAQEFHPFILICQSVTVEPFNTLDRMSNGCVLDKCVIRS